MSAVVLRMPYRMPVLAAEQGTPWDRLTDRQRGVANERLLLIRPALDKVAMGISERKAAAWLVATHSADVSAKTVERYLAAYRTQGPVGLADVHKGRPRGEYGWEAQAEELFNTHANRKMATVAYKLQKAGFKDATAAKVRCYIKSLPSQRGAQSPARVGPHEHKLSFGRYLPRHTRNLPVGLIYQGDGHKCDAYVADPDTGHPIRLELVAWIDVASRRIVGWHFCEDESSVNTLAGLSNALVRNAHCVAALHTDNGAFRARMMADQVSGYYARFGIRLILAIPGNPHGKGHIERWFGTYKERFDKDWDTYCGPDVAPEHNRRITIEVKQGKRQLPRVEDYVREANRWIEQYNSDVHGELDGRTPNEVWAAGIEAERVALIEPATAIVRPRSRRRARNTMVTHYGRLYQHAELASYNPAWVLVEYDLTQDSTVRILTEDGRYICEAPLIDRAPYLSDSYIADLKINREREAVKRLERHAAERISRSRQTLGSTASDTLKGLQSFGAAALPQPEENEDEGLPPLDLLNTDY